MKKIIKNLVREIAPNDSAYYQVLLNLITIRYSYKFLFDRNLLFYKHRLRSLANKYRNKRCFIMGNGPSLNKTPLELLENEYVWGLNRCNLLFEKIHWRPRFYIAIDRVVVPDNAEEIEAMVNTLQETLFFFPYYFRLRNVLFSSENVFWYKERLSSNNVRNGYFSPNPRKYVRTTSTVTIAALQLAVYLGFNPIYLIGCDTDYRRIGKITSKNEDGNDYHFIGEKNDDIDHFRSDYFGKKKAFNPPHPKKMIDNYAQAKKVCDALGVEVYNATIGGKLEIFPRVKFEDLF